MPILIEQLGLSNRTLSRLKLRNIWTAESLTHYTKEELSRFNGFGKTCLKEVIEKLAEQNLSLKPDPLDQYGFSARTFGVLKRVGIKRLDELTKLSEDNLLRYKNAGTKVLDEIKRKLNEAGLELKSTLKSEMVKYDLRNDVHIVGELSNVHCIEKSDTLLLMLTIVSKEGRRQTFQCIYFGTDVLEKQAWLVNKHVVKVRARVYKGQYRNISFRIKELTNVDGVEEDVDPFQVLFSGFISNPYQTKTGIRFELHKNEREFLVCHVNVSGHIEDKKQEIRTFINSNQPILVQGNSGVLSEESFILHATEQFEKVNSKEEEKLV